LARIGSAHDVAFGSYFLGRGPVREALTAAALGGAHVAVTLQADPYRNPYGARANADTARALRGAGAGVSLLPRETAPFHLKAAVCDGVAYLDDRNFTQRGPEIVVADDDPRDVALVRDALAGRSGAGTTLATRKDEALRLEAAVIDAARGKPVTVETERVGGSPVTAALRRHARSGAPTTLIVGRAKHLSARERATLAGLGADGVAVRRTGTNEKLALAGGVAWIGSGNATGAFGRGAGQLEWGLVTRNPALVGAVHAALERDTRSG
jgi:nucleotide-binding universal stress UspA family protein